METDTGWSAPDQLAKLSGGSAWGQGPNPNYAPAFASPGVVSAGATDFFTPEEIKILRRLVNNMRGGPVLDESLQAAIDKTCEEIKSL